MSLKVVSIAVDVEDDSSVGCQTKRIHKRPYLPLGGVGRVTDLVVPIDRQDYDSRKNL